MHSSEQVETFLSHCIVIENLAILDVLRKFDPRHMLILAAIKECQHGKFTSLEYLARKRDFSVYTRNNPLREIVTQCFNGSAAVSAYPFCKWEDLAYAHLYGKRQEIHNHYRKGLRVLLQNGVGINSMAMAKLSPFMQAASHSLICLLLDFLRYGSGIYIHRKIDVQELENIVFTAISHTYRSSGLRRKFLRVAFVLLSFCVSIPKSVVNICVKESGNSLELQPKPLRSTISVLHELVIHRSRNVCPLLHICRVSIIKEHGINLCNLGMAKLPLPTKLKDYISLLDIQEQDRNVCRKSGRFNTTPKECCKKSGAEICACFPF